MHLFLFSMALTRPSSRAIHEETARFLRVGDPIYARLTVFSTMEMAILTAPLPYQGLPTPWPTYFFLGVNHTRNAWFLVASRCYFGEFTVIENKKNAYHATKMAYTGCVLSSLLC